MQWFACMLLASAALISSVVASQEPGQNAAKNDGYRVVKKKN